MQNPLVIIPLVLLLFIAFLVVGLVNFLKTRHGDTNSKKIGWFRLILNICIIFLFEGFFIFLNAMLCFTSCSGSREILAQIGFFSGLISFLTGFILMVRLKKNSTIKEVDYFIIATLFIPIITLGVGVVL